MSITGDLAEVKLLDLIQLICSERDTARLKARRGRDEAAIYVTGGEIVHARLGSLAGAEALYETLSWETGTFQIEKDVESPGRTIDEKWAPLLLEGLARIEAQKADLGLAAEGLVDAEDPTTADAAGAAWGSRLEALPGVEDVVVVSREGLGMTYATSSRGEDEGALAAFVGSSARAIGEALSLGELRQVRMVVAGARRIVLDTERGYVGLRISRSAEPREVIESATRIVGEAP